MYKRNVRSITFEGLAHMSNLVEYSSLNIEFKLYHMTSQEKTLTLHAQSITSPHDDSTILAIVQAIIHCGLYSFI